VDYAAGDSSSNWAEAADYCTRGRSPGRLNGAAGGICDPLLITEVMANALDEDTGEFIEIYNAGYDTVDLAGLTVTDGDQIDTLTSFSGGSTELAPGGYALIVDSEYASDYTVSSDVIFVTTEDTTLGNSLSVADEVSLLEGDGSHLVDAFLHPRNPGNGISTERIDLLAGLDSSDNWTSSTCASGSSPGADNCAGTTSTGGSASSLDLVLTEIMSNPLTESTGEFVEIYNAGSDSIDLLYFVLYDSDAIDTILGYTDIYDTVLEPGGYAVILDADYDGVYSIPSDALLLTTDDSTIGSGLATNDEVYLLEDNGSSLIDSYTFTSNPGNGISVEKVDLSAGDASDNWEASDCASGSSPGDASCF
jgi:hypothetical protein